MLDCKDWRATLYFAPEMKATGILTWPLRLALAVGLCVALAVPPPAASQDAQRSHAPALAAKQWAEELMRSLASAPRRDDKRLALQPLEPSNFKSLAPNQRQRVYEWLWHALQDVARDQYELVALASLEDISVIIENSLDANWWEQYLQVLENAQTRIKYRLHGRTGAGRDHAELFSGGHR